MGYVAPPAANYYTPSAHQHRQRGHQMCDNCGAVAPPGIQFRACGNCMSARYCSVECSKIKWPSHNALCKQIHEEMKKAERQGQMTYGDPQLAMKLREFLSVHNQLLNWTGFQALEVRRNPSNIRYKVLCIDLEYRPHREAHRCFSVLETNVVPIETFRKSMDPLMLNEIQNREQRCRASGGLGVFVVFVQCGGVSQVMPVELDPPSKISWDARDDWEPTLRHFVNEGRKDFKPISTTSRGAITAAPEVSSTVPSGAKAPILWFKENLYKMHSRVEGKHHQFFLSFFVLWLLFSGQVPFLHVGSPSFFSLSAYNFFAMFAKLASTLLLASIFVVGIVAKPVPISRDISPRGFFSFNHWGGLSSFDNFDKFYGVENFDSSVHFSQVLETSSHLVCHTQAIEIIQQRLLVLQEMAKRIILEQVCEVETQTVVFEQFHASLGLFRNDLHRVSGHHVGFDSAIASHFGSITQTDGSLSVDNFGFTGLDLGSHTAVVDGSNWSDLTSPASVSAAFGAAHRAVIGLH
ncbi:hypothetical protein AN958_09013 [Leucoagaricus sp. SymC.cos]|nr:hypothetical protein AN958_09013 [Leucoagaricus sp. SymC.cos]